MVLKKILILVKAYPEESKKYGSSVCTAGLTDNYSKWIRIYPIRLDKFIDNEKKIKKWTLIKADVSKSDERLKRKESYKVKENSITPINTELTQTQKISNIWEKRNKIILPMLSNSIKELNDMKDEDRTSIGLIKPTDFEFYFRKSIEEIEIVHSKSHQKTLDGKIIITPDKIGNFFAYKFRCGNPDCPGHDMICEDWEIRESFRNWKKRYNSKDLEANLIQKYNNWMKETRDLYFIMGTTNPFNTWVIIGLYYPPKSEKTRLEHVPNQKKLSDFF